LIVDKVVLEPSNAPKTIHIWGSFIFATQTKGRSFSKPVRGLLYYMAPQGKDEVCRKEWNDLKKVAGTGQVIGFGNSYDLQSLGKVRNAGTTLGNPDTYPLGSGLVKCRTDTNYGPIRNLLALPAPKTPAEGDLVPPGNVTLVVRNMADTRHARAKYVFVLQGARGEKEEGTVEAGTKETRWAPNLKVKAGEKYTWSVRATQGSWKGPVATSSFVVKGQRHKK